MKFSDQRKIMIQQQLISRGIISEPVLTAFLKVPRESFVSENMQYLAYSDTPLAIGENQTISQPFIVAEMLQLLDLKPGHKVLEIGTGSGYQTALLAEMCTQVFTIERLRILSARAKRVLEKLHYDNIQFDICDGTLGWQKSNEKFDRIIVSAAAPKVPTSLINQLAPNGVLIIPEGGKRIQQLEKITEKDGDYIHSKHGSCMFVPLIGEEGW